ncbi:MAG: PBP1A family penicillin-binding protein [Bacillaceae bacterium]|nr:PBP1A family penicillin-binding protein [Bacillaceae bacterium]
MLFFVGVFTLAGIITVFAIIKGAPELDPEKLTLAQTPQLFDMNDEFFASLSAVENRRLADISNIPPLVQDAFIAVEDVRFRQHFGIDIRRIGGALRANVTSGFGAEGASTITQQVVRNLFLSHDKRLTRKIQEQYLAIKLERQYSKDQILEMYLNAIYFSAGRYGVVEAADYYFSKSLDELTIEDAALLAGIPQRPNFFNPLINPEAAERRRNTVIALMERHGKITSEQAERAMAVAVVDQLNPSNQNDTREFQAFINEVQRELEQIEGLSSADIFTGGLKIYTTLDQHAQNFTDNKIENFSFPDEDLKTGLTVVDTQTGAIRAIGYRQPTEGVQRGFNYATQAKRQPGSSIKPILGFGPAIEHLRWSTYHQVVDEQMEIGNWKPTNWDNRFQGPMSIRTAMLLSRNIPAIQAFMEVGPNKAREFAEGLGIPDLENINASYSIGGFTTGVSSREMAGAFAAFGNEGIYNRTHTVRKIEFPDGTIIDLTPESHVAMSDYTAFMISDLLKSSVNDPRATGRIARIDGLPIAGKTGTSNNNADRWFVGYTTNYSIAVWTGYDDQSRPVQQTNIALELFRAVMSEVSKDKTTADFKQPDSVVRVGIERGTGLLPSAHTPNDQIIFEYFVRGTEPTSQSEVFVQPPTPSNLMAAYDENSDQIVVTWNFPSDELENHTFELQMAINDGTFETISFDKDMQHILFNPIEGATYRFRLRAVFDINNDLVSDFVEIKVTVPKREPEIDEIPIPDLQENEQAKKKDEEKRKEPNEPTEIPDPLDELPDHPEPPLDNDSSGDQQDHDSTGEATTDGG